MKILKTILSQLLIVFNMIPTSTKKAILIYLAEKLAKSTSFTDFDDKFVEKLKDKLK